MIAGLNCDPRNFGDYDALARDLRDAGATMARFPLVDAADPRIYGAFCDALLVLGLQPLPVYARESKLAGEDHAGSIGWWSGYLSNVTHWQIGNEADHVSPSSWTMPESEFSQLLQTARKMLHPGCFIVAGAMVSGNPAYLDGVDLGPVDAIAIHGYGQRPDGYRGPGWGFGWLSDLYRNYERFGKPVWGTEYGGTVDIGSGQFKTEGIFDDDTDRADYYGRYLQTFARAGGAACFPFKYEDEGVPGYGMRGTPTLAAVSEQIRRLTPEIPIPPPQIGETPMEPFRGTIEQWLADHPDRRLWKPPTGPLIRIRGSGTSAEQTAWLDNDNPKIWDRLVREGGYVWTERVYPN